MIRMMKSDPFWYSPVWAGPRSVVAMIGADVGSKQALLIELANQLGMPDDVPPSHMTWDDLVAQLSELDWEPVEGADAVVLMHTAMPALPDDVLAVYLDALRRAIDGRGNERPRLVVVFPSAAQSYVSALARPG
ncbi:MAG: hypothetical protein IT385_06515 [Deltaproteobacteria bacterium]|nr:hypothetical protein [Deltaproteobacteria bacterium]